MSVDDLGASFLGAFALHLLLPFVLVGAILALLTGLSSSNEGSLSGSVGLVVTSASVLMRFSSLGFAFQVSLTLSSL